jgi:phage shock protein C
MCRARETSTVSVMTFDKNTTKEFTRSSSEQWLGGVCAGIADFTGWDVSLVRALTVGAGLVSFGAVVLIYLAAWMLVPAR